jgi:G3E family GTPase
MNEFGDIAIDSKIVEGKNVRLAELDGGCVCYSLIGEFEVAVAEVIEGVDPDLIVVETTGVAEPAALVFNIQESLPQVRLDGVVAVEDADAMARFPQLEHTGRLQIEAADIILLNKIDLVSSEELAHAIETQSALNPEAALVPTRRCQVDPMLLFGTDRAREVGPPRQNHMPEFESFDYRTERSLDRSRFERLIDHLSPSVYRVKGFVRFPAGSFLFNYVGGRWELEPFPEDKTALVFIGEGIVREKPEVIENLKRCEL